jgi:uncharacterized membrane protein AbrB (regulator of aidB expression)
LLATGPGGIDAIIIIAAKGKVDLPCVAAMQTARFILILLAGPALARVMARRAALGARATPTGNRP